MKNLFLVFSLFSSITFGQKVIFNDSTVFFQGDQLVGLFQLNNGHHFLKIKTNDSTLLYKEYAGNNLLQAYQCNFNGVRNGYFFGFDTITLIKTFGYISNGILFYEYALNINLDTVKSINKINDTLINSMEIKNGEKKMWQMTANNIYNGYYLVYNERSKQVIISGQYQAISEDIIRDKKKYFNTLKKYGLEYSFRGIKGETEIPVGVWNFYDEKGKKTRTIKYSWKGIF